MSAALGGHTVCSAPEAASELESLPAQQVLAEYTLWCGVTVVYSLPSCPVPF